MRTAVYMGLMMVADAIRANWMGEHGIVIALPLFCILLAMDTAEFVKNIRKPN